MDTLENVYPPFAPSCDPPGQQFRLADGRRLGYAEYGSTTGTPVVLFHGLFGSRLQRHPDDGLLTELNIRLIVPERAGFGLSDPHRGRGLSDFAADVVTLADALSLDRFAVLGVSCGAPYALACAAQLRSRVTRVAIVSGIGPVRTRADGDGVQWFHRTLFTLAKCVPPLLALPLGLFRLGLRWHPDKTWARLQRTLPACDQRTVTAAAVRELLLADMREAFRGGTHGVISDIAALSRPWNFAVDAITAPLDIWHGDQDITAPLRMAQQLHRALPHARLHTVPDAGHFLIVDRWYQILSELRG